MENSIISLRIKPEDKKAFEIFCNTVGLNVSSLINIFIKKVINEGKIPFEISVPSKISNEEAREAFYELRKMAKKNNVQGMSLEDINNEINLTRKENKTKK